MSTRDRTVTTLNSTYVQQYHAYQERQFKRRQRLIRRLIAFAIIVSLAIGSIVTYHYKQRMLQAEKIAEYEQLEQELAYLKQEEELLQEEIELLNDIEYILDIARTNYFFSKDGELIFKILEESPTY